MQSLVVQRIHNCREWRDIPGLDLHRPLKAAVIHSDVKNDPSDHSFNWHRTTSIQNIPETEDAREILTRRFCITPPEKKEVFDAVDSIAEAMKKNKILLEKEKEKTEKLSNVC